MSDAAPSDEGAESGRSQDEIESAIVNPEIVHAARRTARHAAQDQAVEIRFAASLRRDAQDERGHARQDRHEAVRLESSPDATPADQARADYLRQEERQEWISSSRYEHEADVYERQAYDQQPDMAPAAAEAREAQAAPARGRVAGAAPAKGQAASSARAQRHTPPQPGKLPRSPAAKAPARSTTRRIQRG